MRHYAFLRILGRSDPESAAARNAAAGLLALRQLDIWADHPGLLEDEHVAAVARRIQDADPAIAHILTAAVRDMARARDVNRMLAPFVAYAVLLIDRLQHTLAVDVLDSVIGVAMIDRLDMGRDPWFLATCYMQLGEAYFLCGKWVRAHESFERVRALLQSHTGRAEREMALLATVRDCMIDYVQGNLGLAKTNIAKSMASFTPDTSPTIRHRALMVRGGIAIRLGNFFHGLTDFYAAFQIADGPRARELSLCDIAVALIMMGRHYDTAMNVYAYMVRHGTSSYVRYVSVVNLLELCVINADALPDAEAQFAYWWEVFGTMDVPMPESEMHGWLFYANSIERWGTRADAIRTYQEVIARAKRAGIHRVVSQAENALDALLRPGTQKPLREPAPPAKSRTAPSKSRTALIARSVDAFCLAASSSGEARLVR